MSQQFNTNPPAPPKIRPFKTAAVIALAVCCCACTALLLTKGLRRAGETPAEAPEIHEDVDIMGSYDTMIADSMADARDGALSVKKYFWLDEDVTVCPEPDQSCYGTTDDPSTLQWLLDAASDILDGQDTLFRTDIEIFAGSEVTYYLDETIFAVTWKQVFDNFVYTISELKIAHASQFRRYLANNEYDSARYYTTTQMADTVNAVVASSGDFYRNRQYGVIVYEGEVKRADHTDVTDTCYIDKNGDLIFTYAGELEGAEDAQKFVDENDISFSIAFGPVLVDNYERCEPASYALGEANQNYPRAALCQRDDLHYVVVVANAEGRYRKYQDIHTFAKNIATFGCEKAYTLDGGQTGVIAMNNELINAVQFGEQRPISDIFYFATALPSYEQGENTNE